MHKLLSYCGFLDAKMSAFKKDLPVLKLSRNHCVQILTNLPSNNCCQSSPVPFRVSHDKCGVVSECILNLVSSSKTPEPTTSMILKLSN